MPKIKEFQKEKGEDWGSDVEDDLARNLVTVDELMATTSEERNIESELRKPGKVKGMDVEMSLKRRDASKEERAANEANAAKAKAKEVAEKKQRENDIKMEDKKMQDTIAAYAKSSQSEAEKEALDKAKTGLDAAEKLVQKIKRTDHFKAFEKEYQTAKPVTSEPDYPTNRLGESQDEHIVKQAAAAREFDKQEDPQAADLSPVGPSKQLDQRLSDEALKELADLKKTLGGSAL